MSEFIRNPKSKLVIIAIIAVIMYAYFGKQLITKNSPLEEAVKPLDKAQVEEIVKNYVLNNPDVLIESLEEMQKRKIKDMKAKVQSLIKEKKSDLEDSSHSPFFGNDKGDIMIVEFYDYNCGYCKKANTILNDLIASDHGVKVILKPLPILGESSEYAAKVALSVYNTRPDKFKAFHNDMMNLTAYNKTAMIELAEKHELEYAKIEDEMEKPEVKDEVQRIRDLAIEIEINGAPAFIINGEHYSGLLDMPKLLEIIKKIRAKPIS